MNKTHILILILFLAAYVSVTRLAIVNVLPVPGIVCDTLQNGGYMVDRYHQDNGNIYTVQGNLVAWNMRGISIYKQCYGGKGGNAVAYSNFVVPCSGCARINSQGTPIR